MVRYIFVIGPVHDSTAFSTRVLQPLLVDVTRWEETQIAVIHCVDDVAYKLRVILEREQWPFLLSSSPQTSRGTHNELLSEALREQWTE